MRTSNEIYDEIKTRNIIKIISTPSIHVIYLIRRMQKNYRKGGISKIFAKYIKRKLVREYGIFIHPNSQIGKGISFPHPNGIIIGENAIIDDNCTIYQQVTIGSSKIGDYKLGLQPHIKSNCVLFSGCKVIGNVIVENNTTIGANAVVIGNTEKNSTYVGIPAKRIK